MDTDIIQLLLDKGVDINMQNHDNNTVLMHAILKNKSINKFFKKFIN